MAVTSGPVAQILLNQSVTRLRKTTHFLCDSEVKFVSNDHTNSTTTLTTLTLTLTDAHNAF